MRETREILVNWEGNLDAFKEQFPRVQVVPIPEMLDNTYSVVYDSYTEIVNDVEIVHDFEDEREWLDNNGTLEVIGKWKINGNKKPDSTSANNHTKTKYRRYLRKVWAEDKQKIVKPPADTPVGGVSGWIQRDIT